MVFLVFVVFLGRLFYLQVVQGEALRVESERNSVRTVRLDAPRGNLLDREGRVIASTRPAFDVEIIPSELRDADRVYSALGQLLDEEASQVRAAVGKPRGRERFQPIAVSSDVSFEQLARVETHRFALPGVVTEVRPQRQYEDGDLAGHLLGTLGEIRLEQLDRASFEDYSAGEIIGQSGLEAVLENVLRGTAGGRNVVVNVAGREVERLDEVEPVPGNTAVLTLDLDLQREAVAAYRNEPPPGAPAPAERDSETPPEKTGALVALDPRTGDVLAMVSRPSFDPNSFADGVPAETWRALTRDERKPLQNRAISGQYPPGSTYKPLLAAAALEAGVITPQTHFFCPGSFALGRRVYKCWRKEGHGSVAVHDALVRSCDVFFYQTGLKLGIDRIADFVQALSFGRLTGISLPEEKPGLIPTEEWKLRRFSEPWMVGETVSASIGQGFDLVTPLQLAVAYGALATGVVVKPRLVLRVEKPDGSLLQETKPKLGSRLPISEANLAIVRKGLAGVVNEPGGTGGRAPLPGIPVAGKTVLNAHAGHGGSAAAPIAQRILAKYFEKQGRLTPEALLASQAPKAAAPRPQVQAPEPPPPPPTPSEPAGPEPPEGGSGDAAD